MEMTPEIKTGTLFIPIFPFSFKVILLGDRWVAPADWPSIPRTIIYTATNTRLFLLSQEVHCA
jgi:hypothetical protein